MAFLEICSRKKQGADLCSLLYRKEITGVGRATDDLEAASALANDFVDGAILNVAKDLS